MKIIALVENTTDCGMKTAHGLSLYIETEMHRLLFDLGPDNTIFENAEKLHVDLKAVDTVILSHGHNDHGGALAGFLNYNPTAKVYVQRSAFEPHFSRLPSVTTDIGLDRSLADDPRVILLDGDTVLDSELQLFTVPFSEAHRSNANDVIYDEHGLDHFKHEQHLIISGSRNALIMGCGHTGIINILEKAEAYKPGICVGGFHLFIPSTGQVAPEEHLREVADELKKHSETDFYTCHCTGTEAYEYLSSRVSNLHYLHCGDCVTR